MLIIFLILLSISSKILANIKIELANSDKKQNSSIQIAISANTKGRLFDFQGERRFGIWPLAKTFTTLTRQYPNLIKLGGGAISPNLAALGLLLNIDNHQDISNYFWKEVDKINYHALALTSHDLRATTISYLKKAKLFTGLNINFNQSTIAPYQLLNSGNNKLLVASLINLTANLPIDIVNPVNKYKVFGPHEKKLPLPPADLKILFIDGKSSKHLFSPALNLLRQKSSLNTWDVAESLPQFDIYITTSETIHQPTQNNALLRRDGKIFFEIGKNDERILFLKAWFIKGKPTKISFNWILPELINDQGEQLKDRFINSEMDKIRNNLQQKIGWRVLSKRYSSYKMRECLRELSISSLLAEAKRQQIPLTNLAILLKPLKNDYPSYQASVTKQTILTWLNDYPLYIFSVNKRDILAVHNKFNEYQQNVSYYYSRMIIDDNQASKTNNQKNDSLLLISSSNLMLNSTFLNHLNTDGIKRGKIFKKSFSRLLIDYIKNNSPPPLCQKIFTN
ncbi:MAG: hypothetical protein JJV97_06075 [SAR324 cluster bacterium]|nr:hypothetical protein [SAR324 cluster bacterium]